MSPDIDQDALDKLARKHKRWRNNHDELSRVYVSGEGDNPSVMVVGEAPGATEEIRRRPFVGDSGLILRSLMASARLHTRDWQTEEPKEYGLANCWLTNVVKFRPPRNRTPTLDEVISARHLLHEEWVAIGKPLIVVAVGAVALTAITGKPRSILAVAGSPISHVTKDNDAMSIWPMIHPSMGVREKSVRPVMEKHWEALNKWLWEHD